MRAHAAQTPASLDAAAWPDYPVGIAVNALKGLAFCDASVRISADEVASGTHYSIQ